MHDVLVVNSGLALVRTTVNGVQQATADHDADALATGIDDPVILTLTFDDGSQSLLAAPPAARASIETLTGSVRKHPGSPSEAAEDHS